MSHRNTCLGWLRIIAAVSLLTSCGQEKTAPKPQAQFPSPMVEHTRAHRRLAPKPLSGTTLELDSLLSKPVQVYIPGQAEASPNPALLIHFHGMPFIPMQAVDSLSLPVILVVVNLGSGSSVYERPFAHPQAFPRFLNRISAALQRQHFAGFDPGKIYLSGFSAGYGAARAILRYHMASIAGLLLLDGLHTDYVPARTVLAQGGRLNAQKLAGFLRFARLAARGQKRLVITHSEIFPGTYASTTETTDFIIEALGLQRQPVLEWGPVGMQLLSRTEQRDLVILGFAGNSAPDHVDHLHGINRFLKMLLIK